MTALLYFLVAVIAVSLPTQAWLADRDDPARAAFLGLGWAVGLAYFAFALSLLPGLAEVRVLYTAAGCFVPATLLMTIDRVFWRESLGSRWMPLFLIGAALVAPVAATAHLGFYMATPRASPPEVLAGLFSAVGFAAVLRRLWEAREDAALPVEKTRIGYLQVIIAGAILFTVAEQLARGLGTHVDPAQMSLARRGVALQGAIPPFGVVFAGLGLYVLFHSVRSYRLLDPQELLSRAAILLISAGVLLLVDGITFIWVDTFTVYPFHSTFQLFLASLMFLAAYDPLREGISFVSNRVLNVPGQQLGEAIDHLVQRVPGVITAEALTRELLDPLHASGRVPRCAVYLWDPRNGAFRLAGSRGTSETPPLGLVAPHPFIDGFEAGEPWYHRGALIRRARHTPQLSEMAALMDAMEADLTMPFVSGGVVLGWLHLAHEPWADGFGLEEMQRLVEVAELSSVVLSNVAGFKALEQAHRLAALGRMSAGLAHEIRNPLAGVKGAAQYLEHEELPTESKEMLQVIIEEVDRLDVVVSQFLDYARPVDLNLRAEPVNSIVSRALMLLRAQGLPDTLTVEEQLADDLPLVQADASRLSQVFTNLLRNAQQAVGDTGTLTVATLQRMGRAGRIEVEVSITDDGGGIESDDMDNLFIPFFTTKSEGTGLGLPISQRIVQAHDGEINVQSRAGEGATFRVRLPAVRTQTD